MKNKTLVELDFGAVLLVQADGDVKKFQYSGQCPSPALPSVERTLDEICNWLADKLGVHYRLVPVETDEKTLVVER